MSWVRWVLPGGVRGRPSPGDGIRLVLAIVPGTGLPPAPAVAPY